jgi:hypothetical protein
VSSDKPTEDADPPADPAAPAKADAAPSESGSIDVVMSGRHPAVSGSIEVDVSSAKLPQVDTDGAPVPVPAEQSSPVASGAVHAAVATETSRPSTKQIADGVKEVVSGGITVIGTSIGVVGEGVAKLGEKSKKVPLVGSSVSALGESLTSVGESLTELPRVAGTRRGRLLVRSLVVGFVLVFAWIVIIVALQLRGGTTEQIDFRPMAEKVLIELSSGSEAIAQIYEKASPRFQEFVGKERFVDDMLDLQATIGKFKEISAVNDTLVTRGPTGRVGRVSLTVAYEKGKTKASVSLHQHEGEWKLLGVGIEIPPEVKITQREREERVQPCKEDPMDPRKCDLYVAANTILEQLRDNQAAQVWDAASPIFQKQEDKARWVQIQHQNQTQLGEFRRIIAVTEQRVFRSGNCIYDVLVEYARSQGVRVIFGFNRMSKNDPWKLISLKTVVPMPRADEGEPPKSLGTSPTGNPPIAEQPPASVTGSGSNGSGSGKPAAGGAKRPVQRPKANGSAGSGSSTGSASPPVETSPGTDVQPPPSPGASNPSPPAGSGSS